MRSAFVWLCSAALLGGIGPASRADEAQVRSPALEYWQSLAEKGQAPVVHKAEGFESDGALRPLFYEGLPYKGKPTRVFAWYGAPSTASDKQKVPAVVLVHGGGGTAFRDWVRKWNDHGFAAISIAVEGQTDERGAEGQSWKRHAWAGPARQGIYADASEPVQDQWMLHAVADVVLANSLLRSFPEVDAEHIGICGISWGGVIVSTAAGADHRLAFAIPIYGCGALDRAPNQYGQALKTNSAYRDIFEPCLILPRAKMPILWLTWLRDGHFPLDSQQTSYQAAPGPRTIAVLPDMGHSHEAGWNPSESYAFAESVVKSGKSWISQKSQGREKGEAFVEFDAKRPIQKAKLYSSAGEGYTGTREWRETAARVEAKENGVRVTASLPEGTRSYFFNVEAEGLTASSEYAVIPVSPPAEAPKAIAAMATAAIESTLKTESRQIRQLAFDGDSNTGFVSAPGFGPNDHFTLKFDRPVLVQSIEVLTGQTDGADPLDSADLEYSSDGKTFATLTPFANGKAQAKPESPKPWLAIRVKPTKEAKGRLAVREIAIKSEPKITTFQYPVEFEIDVTDAPDLKEWAEKVARECERYYPTINEELRSEGYQPARQIRMTLSGSYDGVAMAGGARITGSVKYFRAHPDDIGAMIHETVHVVQRYRSRGNPSWLVEGVADYVRFFKYEPSKIGPINPNRARYNASYRVTAAFLNYVAEKYDKKLVLKLNQLMREGKYKEDVFKEWTGKTLSELGDEWRATLKR